MEDVIEGSRPSRAARHEAAAQLSKIKTARPPRTTSVVRFGAFPALSREHPLWQAPTPSLILSPKRAAENFRAIQAAFPGAVAGYAMKSNPHPAILAAIADVDGSWFEVASKAEITALADLGVGGDRVFFSNPVKQPAHIAHAVKSGVRLYVYDSEAEVEKLAQFNDPNNPLEVYVRMSVPHTGALWPLTHKFGVEPMRAVELLKLAQDRGLKPVGLAFHVGSQCTRPETWADALRAIAPAWQGALSEGIDLDMVDIGGGFPAQYTGPVPSPRDVAKSVNRVLGECVPGAKRVFIEPGRGVCADAADMLLTVTGVADRPDGQTWLYVDGGYFSGLYEIPDGIRPGVHPVIRDSRPMNLVTYRLAGPTCDSIDTLFEIRSPVELKVGDRLILKNTGAYVYSVGSPFNGFPLPETLNEDEWMLNLDEFAGIC